MKCNVCNEGLAGAVQPGQLCMSCWQLKTNIDKKPEAALRIIGVYHNHVLQTWLRKIMAKL